MIKIIMTTISLCILLAGCAGQLQNKKVTSLIGMNQALPMQIDKDTRLLLVSKKTKNNEDILIYNYQLQNYDKYFFDFNTFKTFVYKNKCENELVQKTNITSQFIYLDKNFNLIGEMFFSRNICQAMKYVFSKDFNKFESYLNTLNDDEYLNLGLGYDYLPEKFSNIYIERFGNIEIKE